jgi:hypothetical protein
LLRTRLENLRQAGEPVSKIPMIKYLRETARLDLKQAKDTVEDFGARHGIPELQRGGAGCLPMVLIFAVMTVRLLMSGA